MSPPGWKVSNMLVGKSRGEPLIVPGRMKQLGQSRNDTQFWMCLLMKVKSDAIKNWNVRNWNVRSMNQGKIGYGQTGGGKDKHQHPRNQ